MQGTLEYTDRASAPVIQTQGITALPLQTGNWYVETSRVKVPIHVIVEHQSSS